MPRPKGSKNKVKKPPTKVTRIPDSRFTFLRMLAAVPSDVYNKIKKMVLEALKN